LIENTKIPSQDRIIKPGWLGERFL